MTNTTLDRNELKSILRELLMEEPEILINALRTLSQPKKGEGAEELNGIGEDELKKIVQGDFAELEAVFRALA